MEHFLPPTFSSKVSPLWTEQQNKRGCVSFDNCMLDLQINVGSIVAKSGFVSTNKVSYRADNLIISLLKIMSLLCTIIMGMF